MGCWNESDAVTHTALEGDDPVVMVVLTERGKSRNWWIGPWFDIPRDIEAIHKGTYNGYGWIKEKEASFDMDIRPDYRSVFFHQDTWNAILAKYGPTKDLPINSLSWKDKSPEHLEELVAVMNFASSVRIDLSCGLPYKGAQSNYQEDRKNLDFHMELMASSIRRMDECYLAHGGTLPLKENSDDE